MHAPRTPSARERAVLALQRAAPYLALVALNCALFVPSFVCSRPVASFWPFFPEKHAHGAFGADLRSAYQYVLALGLRRDNLDVFRASIDFAALLTLVVWTARSRLRHWACALAAIYYVALWLFLAYHHGVAHYFERTPALGEDMRLALNLWHFLEGYARYAAPAVALALGALWLLGTSARRSFAGLQLRAAGWSGSRRLLLGACWIAPAVASLLWFGVQRDDPLWQLSSKRVFYNYQASRAEAVRLRELRDAPADLRYEAYSELRLARKPDVYLLMIEAYGEILATWDMRDAYQSLMSDVAQRLGRAGYHAATAYSAAPVHGGTSWFSIATVHTGVTIDRPQIYAALEHVGARVPSLTRFFREQGYLTHSLQPGSWDRSGLHRFDLFHHAIPVDGETLAYRGKKYGWGRIPDQYSLGVFRERFFRPVEQPRYAFYMCLSTHYPWDGVPNHVRDWPALASPELVVDAVDDTWPLANGYERIGTELRRSYFRSVSYEWQLLVEWLAAEARRDNVVLIVGDHQPRLEWNVPGAVTMNTPVHVLSQDRVLVDRFVAGGFEPGLYAEPKQASKLQHAGLFSLLISQLSARYASQPATYYPHGLPLPALQR